MKTEEIRELKLLTEISSGGRSVTQRHLAKSQGVALGLANLLVRRLVKKGFIKIRNMQGRRWSYLITPQGIAEKARLTYEYLGYSLYFYRQIRTFLTEQLTQCSSHGGRNVVILGTGEVAEIAYLTMRQLNLHLVGVIDRDPAHQTFLGYPVYPFADLANLSFDIVVVASMKDRDAFHHQLVSAGVNTERIVAIPDHI